MIASIWGAMKNTKRFILGVLSSVLLAVGFVQAAEKLDPVSNDVTAEVVGSAPDSATLTENTES